MRWLRAIDEDMEYISGEVFNMTERVECKASKVTSDE